MIGRIFWNKEQHRITMLWRLALQTLLFLLMATVLPAIAMIGAAPLLALGGEISLEQLAANWDPATIMLDYPAFMLVGKLAMLAGTIISVWLAGRFLDRRRFADFGLRLSRRWWADFGFGLFLGAFLMLLIFLVEWAAGWITVTGTFANTLDHSFAAGFGIALVNFIAVGVQEELLSRGYHIKNLSEGLTGLPLVKAKSAIVLAVALSSALFGFMHAGNPNSTAISTFNIFLAGIFLAMGFVLTGELAIPIGVHITWNLFQGRVFGFPVSGLPSTLSVVGIRQGGEDWLTGGAFGPEAGLIGIGAMVLGSILTLVWVRSRYGRAKLYTKLATPDLLRRA